MSHIKVEMNGTGSSDKDRINEAQKTVVIERPMVGDFMAVHGSVWRVDIVRLIAGRVIDMKVWLTYVGPDDA